MIDLQKLTPRRWFPLATCVLMVAVLIYLLLHWFLPAGGSKIRLSSSDVATISSLLYTDLADSSLIDTALTDSVKRKILRQTPMAERPLNETICAHVADYLQYTYPVRQRDSLAVLRWVNLYHRPAHLINALDTYLLPVSSYFWLCDDRLYIEVIFWTWFGLIASLLYSVSESLRKGTKAFDHDEVWVHFAKFFYAPLISLVLFTGLNYAINDKTVVQQVNYSSNQILVAFIMGFFSGRFVQLLQRIKDLLFPDAPATGPATTAAPTTATDDDIRQAVDRLGDRWRLTYPNVTGIALQTKQTDNKPTGQLAALFEVSRKVTDLKAGAIPSFLLYNTPDGRLVNIPTDVVEVGVTRLAAYVPGAALHKVVPTAPGGSIRRTDLNEWGTLGLYLSDGKNDYVLACYHVLCADRVTQGKFTVGDEGIEVVAPGVGQQPVSIGTLVGGQLNETSDFAIVRLNTPRQVDSHPLGLPQSFHDIINQTNESLEGRMVSMVGACSNFQTAKVLSPYQAGDFAIANSSTTVVLKGLLKTERMADHGDSGAAVYVEENGKQRVVGLLVGFNDLASYVLPIDATFLKQFSAIILRKPLSFP